MSTLVVAEHDGSSLNAATRNAIQAASGLGGAVDVLVAGHNARAVADLAAGVAGTTRVLLADNTIYQHGSAEDLAALIVPLAGNYSHVAAAATAFGKNLLPRVAALLDVAQISDVCAVVSADTFVRPIYAGNALATVQSSDTVKIMTIRASAFPAAGQSASPAPVEEIAAAPSAGRSRFLNAELVQSERPDLQAARVVVSGGRGMQSAENFKILESLADKLGAAVGASRAAVDAGYASNELQVGQTGKIVAPELYIAVGISGAIQHLAGMKDSKIIVAINKDEEAPIFQVADYGIVGDLFEVLPELEAALASKG